MPAAAHLHASHLHRISNTCVRPEAGWDLLTTCERECRLSFSSICSQEMEDTQMQSILIDVMTCLEVQEGAVIITQHDSCALPQPVALLRSACAHRD